MNNSLSTEEITRFLKKEGPSKAKEVCQYLNISQAKFSRQIKKLAENIVVIGKSVNTQYAFKRTIDGRQSELPIYLIDEKGRAVHAATLTAVYPKLYIIDSYSSFIATKVYEDLPYWLSDLRPSGFLGRLIPRKYPHLNFPPDIRLWSADICISYWSLLAWDLIGNLIIGEKAYQLYQDRLQDHTDHIEEDSIVQSYSDTADQILQLGAAGSSAGGEQPKFLAIRANDTQPVIVKFSPEGNGQLSCRRKDLLVMEHLCHKTLNQYQTNLSARSRLIISDQRVFLEIERFDRDSLSARHGIISLASLDAEFTASMGNWREIASALLKKRIISKALYSEILFRYYFGALIANTDMHPWNLSFYCKGEQILKLAPAYDMLPMLYAPYHDQIVEREFDLKLPLPQDSKIWEEARKIASYFWKAVSQESQVSNNFRDIAKDNLARIESLA